MTEAVAKSTVKLKEGEELFHRLAVSFSDYRVFGSRHPRFLASSQLFVDGLDAFFAQHTDLANLLFVRRRDIVYFRRMPLHLLTPPAIKLVALLGKTDTEGLRFTPATDLTALTSLVEAISSFKDEGVPVTRAVNGLLESRGVKDRVGVFEDRELAVYETSSGLLSTDAGMDPRRSILSLPQLSVPLDLYRSTLSTLHDVSLVVGRGSSPQVDSILDMAARITEGIVARPDTFLPLATVEYEGEFTFNHSVNVFLLVVSALKSVVQDPGQLARAGQAALLHDVGKSLVSEDLLYTPSVPGIEERREIERHVVAAAEVLRDTKDVAPISLLVALDHHRREGGGYPATKRDRPIHFITKLVAAADIFEALTAKRPYKAKLTAADAFRIVLALPESRGLEKGIRLLFDAIGPYPPGSFVELSSGETAVVTGLQPGAPEWPRVRLVDLRSGLVDFANDEIDLSATRESRAPVRVRNAISPTSLVPEDEAGTEPAVDDVNRRVADGTLLASEA